MRLTEHPSWHLLDGAFIYTLYSSMQQAGHVKAFPKVSSEVLVYTNCYNLKQLKIIIIGFNHKFFKMKFSSREFCR
jgi:hypothetical protein